MRVNTRSIKASEIRVGDRVVFLTARFDYVFDYVVERIEKTSDGMIRHHHRYRDDKATFRYWPHEMLYVSSE